MTQPVPHTPLQHYTRTPHLGHQGAAAAPHMNGWKSGSRPAPRLLSRVREEEEEGGGAQSGGWVEDEEEEEDSMPHLA